MKMNFLVMTRSGSLSGTETAFSQQVADIRKPIYLYNDYSDAEFALYSSFL